MKGGKQMGFTPLRGMEDTYSDAECDKQVCVRIIDRKAAD